MRRAAIALAAAACGLLVVRAALPEVVRRQLELRAGKGLGLDVSIGDVDVSLLGMKIVLQDVVVAAPPGFQKPEMVRTAEIAIVVDALDRRQSTLSIERIEVNGLRACFERDPDLGASVQARDGKAKAESSEPGESSGVAPRTARTSRPRGSPTLAVESISLSDGAVEWIDRKRSGRTPSVRASWSLLRSGRVVFRGGEQLDKLTIFDAGAEEFVIASGDDGDLREALRLARASFTFLRDGKRRTIYLDAAGDQALLATDADGKSNWQAMQGTIENALQRKPSGAGSEEDKEDGKADRRNRRKKDDSTDVAWDIDASVAFGKLTREAMPDGSLLAESLYDVELHAALGGEDAAETVSLAAHASDGRKVLDVQIAGSHLLQGGGAPALAGTLRLGGFPWHMLLWPAREDDAEAAREGALVRRAMATGAIEFRTDELGTSGGGTVTLEGIDARPDPRAPLARMLEGGSSPATWVADFGLRHGGSPPPLELSFDSETPSSPVLLYALMAEALARARAEAAPAD